ncbi:hypothetical protein LI123_16825 [Phocaeicola vulgatus]|uniref:Uncharacterized protein n=2 Tax=Phocaeicola vulgatus TaxID=821 RepID=A0A395ULR1_PHOVU|nr:hypothetical protein [Phocaeicola vulgatus]MCS3157068.1 hypothetical protein [Phocaeicola dorei]KAB6593159.1 hypothetical protein GAZ81_15350 [Phocaeicola vulgatus]KAB6605423.1 hypothetical protein GAZ67_16445 [Phocaeicola vulgatus]KAB6608029.1 hypothetical protein GAZ74_16410 [Phocaeicola vulgatus]KAB6613278.1 hypothetical protein GAY10_15800 [Phocaeicola vulgatus]
MIIYKLNPFIMIIHLPTGLEFITQKDAKSYFGNHRYRKLVKENKIYFTNYNKPVANDRNRIIIQKNN